MRTFYLCGKCGKEIEASEDPYRSSPNRMVMLGDYSGKDGKRAPICEDCWKLVEAFVPSWDRGEAYSRCDRCNVRTKKGEMRMLRELLDGYDGDESYRSRAKVIDVLVCLACYHEVVGGFQHWPEPPKDPGPKPAGVP